MIGVAIYSVWAGEDLKLIVKMKLSGIFLLAFTVMLSVASFFSYELQKVEQENFASEVLANTERVTHQLITVLSAANDLDDFTCTNDHINTLRELVQAHSDVFDAGFIDRGTVHCTANWGVIKPIKIKAQDVGVLDSYRFFSNEENLYRVPADYNITVKGNFFAVNLTTPYSHILKELPQFQFQIYSKTVDHVFDEYTPPHSGSSYFGFSLNTDACSSLYSYCVKTVNDRAGLPYYSEQTNIIVVIIILTMCFLITYISKLNIANRQSIEARFRKALSDQSLNMEYQPLVSIRNGKIEAVESLVRWTDDVYGRVSPELFISIAEKLSLYPYLARFTTKRALSDMAQVLRKDPEFSLGINIGSYEIREREYLDFLTAVVSSLGVTPSQIKIEITENLDVELAEISDFSKRAQELGFMVVLDDFGTGISNLVWLTEVNFDYIKIDRVFVNALNFDIKEGMARAVMDLVTNLGKEVVFEGVETKREYDLIIENCREGYVQGWYFYRSMPRTELLSLLDKEKS
ncbi:EAL domain-containing protein [Vibrio sp. 1159]|uniref:EAL domain-containing protein n=2 Tax=unclassified Vibrio TaxID=2614977 RepID=UPI002963E8D6|nr:EAL domain-containing protein [Vibrio sp. 1159]MDW2322677.1 EAL domain-containing protein [Vibrio sp. 1159]